MTDNTLITVEQLNAMSDADFVALFTGGPALVALVTALGQQAAQTEEAAS